MNDNINNQDQNSPINDDTNQQDQNPPTNESKNSKYQAPPTGEDYSHYPPTFQKYLEIKKALKGPDLLRDEDGYSPKRFSRTYIEDTCPFCETTIEHEGKKYKYSKVTKKKLIINTTLMLLVGFLTGFGILNIFIGMAAIIVIGYTTSVHAERKMYYSLLCRNCGAHFPMDRDEQEKIRQEQKEKREAEQSEKKQTEKNEGEQSENL